MERVGSSRWDTAAAKKIWRARDNDCSVSASLLSPPIAHHNLQFDVAQASLLDPTS